MGTIWRGHVVRVSEGPAAAKMPGRCASSTAKTNTAKAATIAMDNPADSRLTGELGLNGKNLAGPLMLVVQSDFPNQQLQLPMREDQAQRSIPPI